MPVPLAGSLVLKYVVTVAPRIVARPFRPINLVLGVKACSYGDECPISVFSTSFSVLYAAYFKEDKSKLNVDTRPTDLICYACLHRECENLMAFWKSGEGNL
jgi:hypothetical protein